MNTPEFTALIARIRAEMQQRGWSQRDLAEVMDISEKTLSVLLNGHCNVTAQMAVLLEAALGLPAIDTMQAANIERLALYQEKCGLSIGTPDSPLQTLKKTHPFLCPTPSQTISSAP